MKTELVEHSPTRKELKIEIDAADVRAEYDSVSDRYARLATVPGFRKGHATRAIVRQRFRNEIRSEVMQKLVPQAINDAVTEANLSVIGEPDIHLEDEAALERFGEQPIRLHAHVEVVPEIPLGEYKGLEAARSIRPVSDETVDEMIKNLRESSASLQPVEDRPAQTGDTVTVNFRGHYIDPPEPEDINVEDVEVELGGDGIVPEFTENLLGVRPEDVKTFRVKYAEDFKAQGLAGKEIEYTATVTAVRVKEIPELDDEWVRSLDEEGIDSVESLRTRVRENLTNRAQYESERRLRDAVLGKLVETHPFEVPETLVRHQTQELLRSTMRDMQQRGIDPRGQNINWEGLSEMFRPQATSDVRGSFLLERIADEEQIEVSDEEIETEINSIAEASRQTPEQVRAALTKQGGERSIADRLRHRKALDFIVENANVREEEWREETPPELAEEAEASGDDEETLAGGSASGSGTEASADISSTAASSGDSGSEEQPESQSSVAGEQG